jgi:hypothetical protein
MQISGAPQVVTYTGEELLLRTACQNTVWQPGVVRSFPGTLKTKQVADEILIIFSSEGLKLGHRARLAAARNTPGLIELQAYWVDTQMRGIEERLQGLEWTHQKCPALIAASLGVQRATVHSKHAPEQLLPRNLTKEEHMGASAHLASPFQIPVPLDDDAEFAARTVAFLGLFAFEWPLRMRAYFLQLAQRLLPWEEELRSQMPPSVFRVAHAKTPVFMALQVVLLRWLDRTPPAGLWGGRGHRVHRHVQTFDCG